MLNVGICCTKQSHAINKGLISLYETKKHYFCDNINLKYVYCSFPFLLNGEVETNSFITVEEFKSYIEYYVSKNLTVCLYMTNPYIDTFLLKDVKTNSFLSLLEKLQKTKSFIVVSSKETEKYIRENYPCFEIIYDMKSIFDMEIDFNELVFSNYCILDYDLNVETDLLSNIKNIEKVMIDVNHPCETSCTEKNLCKMNISAFNMLCASSCKKSTCNYINDNYYRTVRKRIHFISYDEFMETYYPLGLRNVKVNDSRTNFVNAIEGYVDFLIKKEHREDFRYILMNKTLEYEHENSNK